MVSRTVPSWIALGLLIAFASGCGSKSPTAPTTPSTPGDQAQVVTTLNAAASLVDDDLEESSIQSSATAVQPAGSASVESAIVPYRWWQNVTSVTRTWSFAFSDTDATEHPNVCVATLSKHMTGSLVIVPLADTLSTLTKPLDKTLTRLVRLERLLLGGSRVWKVVEVSGAFVTTPAPNNTTHIVSVRLVATGVDTTLTDPLQFLSLSHIIRFAGSDTVHLTVTTMRTDDPVFIHLNGIYRWRLHNNLDGTYSTQWVTSEWPGWRHMGVQAMTHASLYDDTAPFDMQAWHFPFRVTQGDVSYYP